jgi:glycosyltransferase involved in cell wall biosynthesis
MDRAPTLAIVIPVRDERATLGPVLDGLRGLAPPNVEIVVVDDGSRDDGHTLVLARGLRLVRHERSLGYGAALKSGLAATRAGSVAIIDADGTYDPGDLIQLWRSLPRGGMAVGVRLEPSWPKRLAKGCFTSLVRALTGLRVPDLNSGLRVFDRGLAARLARELPDRFSFTTALTLGALALSAPVAWRPIHYRERPGGRSKFGLGDVLFMARVVLRGCLWIRRGSVARLRRPELGANIRGARVGSEA